MLLLLLAVLAGIAWYVKSNNTGNAMPVSQSTYAIDDISRVYQFGMIHPDGRKEIIKRTPDGWTYNGRKANTRTVNTFLNTVKKLRILYATPTSMKENMLKSLAINKVKVELYDKNMKPLQIFYVGTTANDGNSTFFIKENSNEPHLVGVPGHVGAIRILLIHPESDWYDKTVFDIPQEKIQSVSLEYPNMRNRSFVLTREGNDFSIRPFYPTTPKIQKPMKPEAGRSYFSSFQNLIAEAYEDHPVLRDSLSRLVPFATLTLKEKDGKVHVAKYYPYYPPDVTDPDRLPAKDRDPNSPIGVNRYFLINENNDCLLTQHRVVGRVLRAYGDFFQK